MQSPGSVLEKNCSENFCKNSQENILTPFIYSYRLHRRSKCKINLAESLKLLFEVCMTRKGSQNYFYFYFLLSVIVYGKSYPKHSLVSHVLGFITETAHHLEKQSKVSLSKNWIITPLSYTANNGQKLSMWKMTKQLKQIQVKADPQQLLLDMKTLQFQFVNHKGPPKEEG